MPAPALVEPIQGISAALLVIVSVGLLVTAAVDVLAAIVERFPILSRVPIRSGAWMGARGADVVGEAESFRSGPRSDFGVPIGGTLGVRAGSGSLALYTATWSTTALLLTLPVSGIGDGFVTEPGYYALVAGGLLVTVGLRDRVRTTAADAA